MSVPATRPPKTPRPWPVPRVPSPASEEVLRWWHAGRPTPWVDSLDASEQEVPSGAPASYRTSLPGGGEERLRWTFCTEAATADEVLLWVNRLSDETDLSTTTMERLEGTDLWTASFVMPDDWIASYCFLTGSPEAPAPWRQGDQLALRQALDRGVRDVRNPRTSRNRAGVLQSVVHGPGAGHGWLACDLEPAGPRTGWHRSEHVVDGRAVVVHAPEGDSGHLPVLVVLDGEVWEEHLGLDRTLARLAQDGRVRPHRLVLVPAGSREDRWAELGGAGGDFAGWICDAALPAVLDQGRPPAAQVTFAGQSLGGLTALRAVLQRPDSVGWCLSQSASLWMEDLTPAVPGWGPVPGLGGIHTSVGTQEWVLTAGHLTLCAALNDPVEGQLRGSVEMTTYQGGHDYAWWRHALVAGLEWQEQERRRAGL